ncbi:hypothetical protein SLEP1_g23228 [Rubroshorea leprosula]|uniref:Uncharacterized protein n=1 Tax=Rubroshorea leprosula TaxID=152421 RepID=A0AAV5JBS8_9ROSI|nr:hypothetical protein SLEP1_g23228 [Rubroshorea leprosula]
MRESGRAREWDSGTGHKARHRRLALGSEKIRIQERGRQWKGVDTRQLSWNGNRNEHREWGYDRRQWKRGNWSSPQRRSKNGRRFGFVRFLNVRNTKELKKQLDQIKVEGHKLWVNLTKYPEEKDKGETVRRIIPSKEIVHGKSYADAVRGQEGRGSGKIEEKIPASPLKGEEWSGLEFNMKEEEFQWLHGSYVGVAHLVEIVPNLQEKFYMEGYFSCRLRAMGGKLVFMDDENKDEIKDLVEGASEWLGQWFSEKVKVNGDIYELKFSEKELTNSLFSLKYDFRPSFNSDSELDESWSDAFDYTAGFDEDSGGAKIGGNVGEDISGRETFPSNERESRLAITSNSEAKFEFEGKSDDDEWSKKKVRLSHSRLGEEESVDVVANSFEMDMEEDDAGERDDIRMCVSGNGYAAKGNWAGEGMSKEYWADERIYISPQMGIEMRLDEGVKKKNSRENAKNKSTNILKNCSSCSNERGSIEGSREEETGTTQKKDKKKIKKRSKSCTSVYQKSILLGFMKQKKKSRGRCGARQAEEEAVPMFLPSTSNSIAGGSVRDSGIQNCNRLLKELPNKQIATDIWEFVKKIGVVAEEEESVIKKLEEMETRDRTTKEKESLKGPSKEQKETKKSGIDRKFCSLLWRIEEFEWVAKDSVGLSGGMVCVWNSKALRMMKVWEEEKVGSKAVTIEMREFNNFIMESELIDIPLVGRKYTWYQPSGKLMSIIGRFLLSEEWLNKWGEATQWGLTRTVSNHCSILLKHQKVNWGLKPFRFFDVWLEQEGCWEVIREAWRKEKSHRWAGFRLKAKLKNTKEALKTWSRNLVPKIERRIRDATAEISQLDVKGEMVQLSEEEIERRRQAFLNLWDNIRHKEYAVAEIQESMASEWRCKHEIFPQLCEGEMEKE